MSEDTAAVLAQLVEKMNALADDREREHLPYSGKHEHAIGIRQARRLVEAAQHKAATGARAAGGGSERDLTPFADTIRYQAAQFRELDKTRLDFDHKFARFALWLEETADGIAPAAAPPTPSAPGVAELLADVRRQAEAGWSTASFTCDEIVRLLAPEGGQS